MFGEVTDAAEGGTLLQEGGHGQALREGDGHEAALQGAQVGAGEGREDGERRGSDGEGDTVTGGGGAADQVGAAAEGHEHQQ